MTAQKRKTELHHSRHRIYQIIRELRGSTVTEQRKAVCERYERDMEKLKRKEESERKAAVKRRR